MGLLDVFRRLPDEKAPEEEPKRKRRNYEAAKTHRLVAGWSTSIESPNAILRYSLPQLRSRARDLERNNPHVQKFFKTAEKNILGRDGIRLQMRIINRNGNPDDYANRLIEEAWTKWTTKGAPTMDGALSFRQAEGLFIRSVMRDGASLIREVRGRSALNPYSYGLHFMEVDHIDHSMENLKGSTRIQMGVEHNLWNRVLGYHILQDHPGDQIQRRRTIRIGADEIIHSFLRERVGQFHGVPWLAQAMIRLKMLDGYEEAELVAARAGAAKMGFLIDQEGEAYDADDEDADGALISDFEAGIIEKLPPGFDFKSFDPQHPNSGFDQFVKGVLRSVAGGLDISYAAFTGDLKEVNFSSIRQGEIADRDAWRVLQGWMITEFHKVVFEHWLEMALTTGAIPLPIGSFEKYNKPSWQVRGWQWVDPVKDAQANQIRFLQRTKSLSEIAAEEGRDLEEVIAQQVRDRDLLEANGFEVVSTNGKPDKEEAKPDDKEDKEDE